MSAYLSAGHAPRHHRKKNEEEERRNPKTCVTVPLSKRRGNASNCTVKTSTVRLPFSPFFPLFEPLSTHIKPVHDSLQLFFERGGTTVGPHSSITNETRRTTTTTTTTTFLLFPASRRQMHVAFRIDARNLNDTLVTYTLVNDTVRHTSYGTTKETCHVLWKLERYRVHDTSGHVTIVANFFFFFFYCTKNVSCRDEVSYIFFEETSVYLITQFDVLCIRGCFL